MNILEMLMRQRYLPPPRWIGSEASRIDRALTQGFVPHRQSWYFHETPSTNIPGLEERGFDLGRINARKGEDQLPNGVYLKRSGSPIRVGGDNAAQIPLLLHHDLHRVKDFGDRSTLARYLKDRSPQYRDVADEQKELDRMYGQRTDDLMKRSMTRQNTPESEAAGRELDRVLKVWGDLTDQTAGLARGISTDIFKGEGYPGVRLWNDQGSWGRKTDTTVVFDPSKLKSPWAKFLGPGIMGSMAAPWAIPPAPEENRNGGRIQRKLDHYMAKRKLYGR